jgi:O-antigen/teichoic acid export membrane protein
MDRRALLAVVARLRRPGLVRVSALTMGTTAAVLVTNLGTGILSARALGTSGRGQLTAISAVPGVVAMLVTVGCGAAVTYHHARRPQDAPALISTWAVMLLPLALIGIVAGEMAIGVALAAQTAATRTLASLAMFTVVVGLLSEIAYGILLADQDFGFYNLTRVLQPTLTLAAYLGLLAAGRLTVATVVLTLILTGSAFTAAGAIRAVRRHGLGRPRLALGRSTLWYGARTQGHLATATVTLRLDTMLLPAFVVASELGLYSVAVTVAEIVGGVSGALIALVLPVAARRGAGQAPVVLAMMYASMAVAAVLGAGLELVGGTAVRLVYGDAFAAGVPAMRVLLPGTVFLVGAGTLAQGLRAANRPLSAATTQVPGAIVTVICLLLLLPRGGGIMAAAVVSTVSYALVFAASVVLYTRAVHLPLSTVFRVRRLLLERPAAAAAEVT